MVRTILLFAGLAAYAAGQQQTVVADGYHVVHPDKPVATPASSTPANTAKKAAKPKKHMKSVAPGK